MSHPREVVRFLIKDIVTFHNELQQISKMMDDIRDLSLHDGYIQLGAEKRYVSMSHQHRMINGGAIKGNRIDLFFGESNNRGAMNFGRQEAVLEII